ncbi:MAG TPA: nuclear transport factor 2 family protein [Terriglobales bacterium]|nr:nuclear transport factor 2 family protein [Terriglobales bacterium]
MKSAIAVVIAVAMVAVAGAAQQHKKHSAKESSSTAQNAAVAAQLEKIEHTWAESEVKHDPAMIAPYLDETFTQINPDNSVSTRQQVLDSIAKADPTLQAIDIADTKTQSYGDAAVIMGRYTEKRESAGKHIMVAGRFTDTYIKRNGQWKCVASHDAVAKD